MRVRLRPIAAAAAGALTALALTGCSITADPDLAVGNPDVCTGMSEVDAGEAVVFGVELAVLDGPVVLDSFELLDADGLELVDAAVMSLTAEDVERFGGAYIGTMRLDDPIDMWEKSVPLTGAAVDQGPTSSLAVAVAATGDAPGRADTFRLAYRSADGTPRELEGVFRMRVNGECE